MLQKLRAWTTRAKVPVILLTLIVVGITTIVLAQTVFTHIKFEAETGTRVGNTTVVTDTTASAGSAISFNASAVSCAISTRNMPDGPDNWGGCWPGPNNTGVPAGTTLTDYTGDCNLSTGTYDARRFNCDVSIYGTVTITRSHFNGRVRLRTGTLTISDSFVDASPGAPRDASGIDMTSSTSATIDRVEVVGGNRSVYCDSCVIRDSYMHGQEVENTAMHASAIRASQNSTIVHNTIWCDPPKTRDPVTLEAGGCSANMTGYPDFEPTMNWLIERNLYMSSPISCGTRTPGVCLAGLSFCAFGGGSPGKPYSNDPLNATNIRFIDNVFRRDSPNCAIYGPIVDFEVKPGNVWQNNVWADTGEQIPSVD